MIAAEGLHYCITHGTTGDRKRRERKGRERREALHLQDSRTDNKKKEKKLFVPLPVNHVPFTGTPEKL